MTSKHLLWTSIALTFTLLAAPVVLAEGENSEEVAANDENICFNSSRVRNFDGLNDEFLFVEVNSTEMYLLRTRSVCFGLRNAGVIAFEDTSKRTCSNDKFIEILVRDMGRTSTCRIAGFERVESKDQARAIVAERVAEKRAAQDAE